MVINRYSIIVLNVDYFDVIMFIKQPYRWISSFSYDYVSLLSDIVYFDKNACMPNNIFQSESRMSEWFFLNILYIF